MSTYAVDSDRQPMISTAIVEKSMEWVQTSDGKMRPGEVQARDENTGMPLWNVEVMYQSTSWGRTSSLTAMVTVGAEDEPKPQPLTPITFTGLTVSVSKNKAGGITERWAAEGIKDLQSANRKPPAAADKAVA